MGKNNPTKIVYFLIPAIILLIAAFILPVYPAVAQNGKTGLNIFVVSGFNSNVQPGKDNNLIIEVSNNGDTTLTNINLSSLPPLNWIVNFSPSAIESLVPGGSQVINVDVIPPKNSARGDYNITFVANSSSVSQAISVYATINSSQDMWLIIGLILAVVVIAIFIFIFFKYNRR